MKIQTMDEMNCLFSNKKKPIAKKTTLESKDSSVDS